MDAGKPGTGMTRNNRLVDIDRDMATPREQAVLDRLTAGRGIVPTPYKIWIHSPELANGMETVGTFLNTRSSLSKAEFEIVVLATVAHWGASYAVRNHTRHALNAGLSEDVVERLVNRQFVLPGEPRLDAVTGLTASALAGGAVNDADFAHYVDMLGRNGIAEIIALIGYYTAVALGLSIHEVAP